MEICAREVGVRCEVDEAEINDELKNLEHSDVLFPPNANAASSLKVVPVHNDMYSQIKCDRNPGHSSKTHELGVGEQSSCTVMIGMEESQGLLLEHKKDGVEEFEEFGQMIQLEESAFVRNCRTFVLT